MKTLGMAFLMLVSFQSFSQHPLSKMGANGKNFKHAFGKNFEPSMLSVHASPSDKYETGANAKNRTIARKEEKKISYYSNQRIVRGKGANAKNRYIRVAMAESPRDMKEAEIIKFDNAPVLQK